jgi:hypothetical protein
MVRKYFPGSLKTAQAKIVRWGRSCCQAFLAVALLGIGPPALAEPGDLATLLDWISGDFDNREQVRAQPVSDQPLYSLLGLQRRLVVAPALGEHVVYAQINNDADPAKVYRQTLVVFSQDPDGGPISSRSLAFADQEANADILQRLADLKDMTAEDFVAALPDACSADWKWRDGEYYSFVDAKDCVITSGYTGKQRGIQSTEFVSPAGIRNEESGYKADGSFIFGLPAGVYYDYRRRD